MYFLNCLETSAPKIILTLYPAMLPAALGGGRAAPGAQLQHRGSAWRLARCSWAMTQAHILCARLDAVLERATEAQKPPAESKVACKPSQPAGHRRAARRAPPFGQKKKKGEGSSTAPA